MFAKSIARGSNYHIGSLPINARSFHSFFSCGGGEGGGRRQGEGIEGGRSGFFDGERWWSG